MYLDRNNRFSNARQNVRYYQIFTGHFKNPSDIISVCLGSRVQAPQVVYLLKCIVTTFGMHQYSFCEINTDCVITFLLEKSYSRQKAIKQ